MASGDVIYSSALSGSATASSLGTSGIKPAVPWPGKQLTLCGIYDAANQTGGNFSDQEIRMVQVNKGDYLAGGRIYTDTGVTNLTATVGIVPVTANACGSVTNCSLFSSTINFAAA